MNFLTPLGLLTGLPLGVLLGDVIGLTSGLVTFGLPAGLVEACRNLARLMTGGRLCCVTWECSRSLSSLLRTTFGVLLLVILCTSSSSLELRLSRGEQAGGREGGEGGMERERERRRGRGGRRGEGEGGEGEGKRENDKSREKEREEEEKSEGERRFEILTLCKMKYSAKSTNTTTLPHHTNRQTAVYTHTTRHYNDHQHTPTHPTVTTDYIHNKIFTVPSHRVHSLFSSTA